MERARSRGDGAELQTAERRIRTLVSARGYLGTPAEYLLETVKGLIEHGVRDSYLMELRRRVLQMHPELAAGQAR